MRKQQRAAVDTAVRMASVDAKLALAHAAEAENDRDSSNMRALDDERKLDVHGWDFVSPHAIEQEYVQTLASSVSLI